MNPLSDNTPMQTMISSTFQQKGWPNWAPSLSKGSSIMPSPLPFSIQMDSRSKAYLRLDDESPQERFEKAISFFDTVQNKLNEQGGYGMDVIAGNLTSHLATVIFGSNHIERAGLGLEETRKICEQIFREPVHPENRSVSPSLYVFFVANVLIYSSGLGKRNTRRLLFMPFEQSCIFHKLSADGK